MLLPSTSRGLTGGDATYEYSNHSTNVFVLSFRLICIRGSCLLVGDLLLRGIGSYWIILCVCVCYNRCNEDAVDFCPYGIVFWHML